MGIKEIKTKEALDQELGSRGNKFILFYSAWDPFSVEFAPVFEKLAGGNTESFCKVSIDTLPDAADVFSVGVVPAVLFFHNGNVDRRMDGTPDRGLSTERFAEFVWLCRGSA
ncbi:MAG: thioredoxin family protein, partial [Elusimicrobiota bacterium]|nr:thioredoxin family protein [Elusimicrobiota bacterium]